MINAIVRCILCIGLCLSLVAESASAEATSDAELKRLLVGRWQETRQLEGQTDVQVMDLKLNGKFEVRGVVYISGRDRPFVWRGTWNVADSTLLYKTTYSDYVEAYPVGESFADKILSVTDSEWRMIEGTTGKESKATRYK